jgi:CPA2 family monovalent cation:H+ antiporter-2
MSLGRTPYPKKANIHLVPIRDTFAVLFFVSIGMLFNPSSFVNEPLLIILVLAVVLVVKPLSAFAAIRVLGGARFLAAPVAASLSQLGEFSFILGLLAKDLGLIEESA